MNITRENKDNREVVLTIELEAEALAKAEARACKNLANRVNIPGFRRGKAPRIVLERYLGKQAILDEAFDILGPKALDDAYKQENIVPVTQPQVEPVTLASGQPVVFKATATPRPDVALGEYKGLVIEKKVDEVTDADVDEQVQHMREHQGTLEEVPADAEVQDGDFTTLDFQGFRDGEPFPGGEGKDYPLQIGSGSFVPGFEEQLVGAKVGEEREIQVTFPEDYHEESLAGQPATFRCTIRSIRRKNLPPVDDELAKKASNFQTLEELRADIRKNLEATAERKAENDRRNAAIEKAAENITVDIPPVMIDNRVEAMVQELAARLEAQGMTLERYLQYANTDMDKIREGYREAAEQNVRRELMLDEVAKAEDIKVDKEDLDREVSLLAMAYGVRPADVRKVVREQGRLAGLAITALQKKTAQFIIDHLA